MRLCLITLFSMSMSEDQPPSRSQKSLFYRITNLFNSKSSKADLREYLQEAKENNIIDAKEAEMMQGVLAVSELKVRDVMIPKSQMVTIDVSADFSTIVGMVNESGHSRFPVIKDGQVQGILLAKDLLAYIDDAIANFDIKKVIRKARVIPESKPLDILLREFRLQRLHMVIISNEYGEVSGLVTIEDVIEEIVGDIDDEYDVEEAEHIRRLDTESYWVDALTEVEEFNEVFHSELEEESAETIGGHLMVFLGYVPPVGEKINYADMDFIVKEADERRIIALVVKYTEG